ncbi:hypothetical protein IWW38_005829, partial [Coemansia aciculifera]
MITIKALLAAVSDTVRAAIDEDTVEYLTSVVEAADASDPTALRDAAEPFLTDAGMSDTELEALFAKLNVAGDTDAVVAASKGPVLLPNASKPQALPAPIAAAQAPAPTPAAPKAVPQQQEQQKQDQPSSSARAPKPELPVVQAYSQQSRFHNETLTTLSKDVDLKTVNVVIGESELLVDARLWLKAGQHYGMVGRNGVGKSTLLSVIGNKTLVGFPENIRTLYVQQLDVIDTSASVIDTVLGADTERQKRVDDVKMIERALQSSDALRDALDAYIARIGNERIFLAQKIATLRSGRRGKSARAVALKAEQSMLAEIREALYANDKTDGEVAANVLATLYAELDSMDAHSAEARARAILNDLDIDESVQNSPVKLLSGGWRMR